MAFPLVIPLGVKQFGSPLLQQSLSGTDHGWVYLETGSNFCGSLAPFDGRKGNFGFEAGTVIFVFFAHDRIYALWVSSIFYGSELTLLPDIWGPFQYSKTRIGVHDGPEHALVLSYTGNGDDL